MMRLKYMAPFHTVWRKGIGFKDGGFAKRECFTLLSIEFDLIFWLGFSLLVIKILFLCRLHVFFTLHVCFFIDL